MNYAITPEMTATMNDDDFDHGSESTESTAPHYPMVAAAIRYLVDHYDEQPSLEEVASVAGLHPHHFQRIFKRWAGISPKRFAQYLTVEHAKSLLAADESVLGTALDVGLSGPSRLHDLFVACEAMTPGEYKAQGRDLVIRYGVQDSPFGRVAIGLTGRGICWLGFANETADPASELAAEWGEATLVRDDAAVARIARQLFDGGQESNEDLPPLLLRGTNFQVKVWQALLRIPPGQVASYQQVAAAIGSPAAVRAVGSAVGSNPVAVIIPCHRVIRKSGAINDYRWGQPRKRALLAWEAGRREQAGAA